MNIGNTDWRQRRNLLNQGMALGPMHYNISNYSTDSKIEKIQIDFGKDDLLDRLHSIPDPLKKNLADTVISTEEKSKKSRKMSLEVEDYYYENTMDDTGQRVNKSDSGTLTGIAGFFTSVFGAISGAMFHRRPKSPAPQYYDCFDHDSGGDRQGTPYNWQAAKIQDQNKNGRDREQFATNDIMSNCDAVANCENKLNAVRGLLAGKTKPNPSKYRLRRPRKRFVEPGSVEDGFQDAFAPEDFVSLENEEYIEYFSLRNNTSVQFCEVEAPKIKSEIAPVQESTEIVKNVVEISESPQESVGKVNEDLEIVKNLPEITESKLIITENIPVFTENKEIPSSDAIASNVDSKTDLKQEIISACEDKMARLKLLLEKRKKPSKNNLNSSDSVLEPVKVEPVPEQPKKPSKTIPIEKKQDKRFKNPCRLSTDKRKRSKLRKNIQEDMSFAHEIDSDDISSVENSPRYISLERLSETPLDTEAMTDEISSVEDKAYFDEVKGRFHSTSTTESEDSFQIVFTDSPSLQRKRRQSDCESEDSFIVFEDPPDSCYTSNDVFGETEESDSDESDSGVSDSGLVCKMSNSLSRTISDLTDDSLYEDTKDRSNDEVDCAVRVVCEEIPSQEIISDVIEETEPVKPGMLVDAARKLKKKGLPAKTVTFSAQCPKVHVMRVWAFAARQARAGHWETHARDRERFKRRIADVDMAVAWVLKPQHRSRVMFQRFMPWWNAQRRKEAADKKKRDEDERLRKEVEEEERLRKQAEEEEERLRKEAEEEEERVRRETEKDAEVTETGKTQNEEVVKELQESNDNTKDIVNQLDTKVGGLAIEITPIPNKELSLKQGISKTKLQVPSKIIVNHLNTKAGKAKIENAPVHKKVTVKPIVKPKLCVHTSKVSSMVNHLEISKDEHKTENSVKHKDGNVSPEISKAHIRNSNENIKEMVDLDINKETDIKPHVDKLCQLTT